MFLELLVCGVGWGGCLLLCWKNEDPGLHEGAGVRDERDGVTAGSFEFPQYHDSPLHQRRRSFFDLGERIAGGVCLVAGIVGSPGALAGETIVSRYSAIAHGERPEEGVDFRLAHLSPMILGSDAETHQLAVNLT